MVTRKLAVAPLAAALLALVLFGWGDAASASASKERRLFPVTVQTANGRVTIRKRPTRIVSLSPTATEILYATSAGRQVVAVDALSNYPRRAPRTRLSGFQPNAEAIAGYRPDLVLVASDGGIVAALRKLRITVLHFPAAANLAQAYAQVRAVGRATGHPVRGNAVASSMRTRIAAAVAAAKKSGSQRLTVYHELTTDYYSATSRTFIGQIYRLLGLRNIADAADASGSGYPQLSAEYIIASNPDLIVLADSKCCGQNQGTVASRPGWSTIRAVRNRRVVAVDDDIASRWGPRIVAFVRAVAAGIGRR